MKSCSTLNKNDCDKNYPRCKWTMEGATKNRCLDVEKHLKKTASASKVRTVSPPITIVAPSRLSTIMSSVRNTFSIAASPSPISPNKNITTANIDERIEKYNKIHAKIKAIPNSCLIPQPDKTLKISTNIVLKKTIGTPSSFGINYLSKIDEDVFATKIQLGGNMSKLENAFLKNLTILAIREKIHHFPILYGIIECPLPEDRTLYPELIQKAPKIKKKYTMSFNELARGDLKSFLYSVERTDELWFNAMQQIIMSLACFHYTGYSHNDSHYGNFLFHKVTPGGCFEYIINDKKYYIPNLGYMWIIWDFGVSGKLYRFKDYAHDYNMLALFMRHDDPLKITNSFKKKYALDRITIKNNKETLVQRDANRKWGNIETTLKIPSKISTLENLLWNSTGTDNEIVPDSVKSEEHLFIDYLADNDIFSRIPLNHIINSININFMINTKKDDPRYLDSDKKNFPFKISDALFK